MTGETRQKKTPAWWIAALGVVILIGGTLFHFSGNTTVSSEEPPGTTETIAESGALFQEPEIAKASLDPAPSLSSEQEALPENESGEEPPPGNEIEQPRNFDTFDFREMAMFPPGFEAENLELTQDGLKLPDPLPGQEESPRQGILNSPPQIMEFPANAVTPLWLEKMPDGTDVFVEIAVSPDGENWGMWHWIEVDDDSVGEIREFYPDGTPNPHYGYTPGGTMAWGVKQWQYYRYRVTLYSDANVSDSPVMSSFRLYYQDSTLGQGHVAEPQKSPSENPTEEL